MSGLASMIPFGDDASLERAFTWLIDEVPAGGALPWLATVLALGLGALHALGPGHGKALVAAHLAGSDGRPRDALGLGGLVAVMHTGSVLVVGVALFATREIPGGEDLDGWLTAVAATAVLAVGVRGVLAHRRERSGAHRASHRGAATSPAVVGGTHVDTHTHTHLPPAGVAPLSRSGIVAIAASGGLLPSPGAFLVLATALAIDRTGYGLALVAAFGIGLGLTLAGIGLAVLYGRTLLLRAAERGSRLGRLTHALPLLSSVAVLLGGTVLLLGAISMLTS